MTQAVGSVRPLDPSPKGSFFFKPRRRSRHDGIEIVTRLCSWLHAYSAGWPIRSGLAGLQYFLRLLIKLVNHVSPKFGSAGNFRQLQNGVTFCQTWLQFFQPCHPVDWLKFFVCATASASNATRIQRKSARSGIVDSSPLEFRLNGAMSPRHRVRR